MEKGRGARGGGKIMEEMPGEEGRGARGGGKRCPEEHSYLISHLKLFLC